MSLRPPSAAAAKALGIAQGEVGIGLGLVFGHIADGAAVVASTYLVAVPATASITPVAE